MTTEPIAVALARLRALTVAELRAEYARLLGVPSASRNKAYLFKRVAYRLQEVAEGRTLSPDALERARRLAATAEARVRPPRGALADATPPAPSPMPAPGPAPSAPSVAPESVPTSVPATTAAAVATPARDPRLPPAGAILTRMHNGVRHEVTVGEKDFGYRGRRYASLSAVAKLITGTTWNGWTWFGLTAKVRP
jgi:hypothetical protein